MSESRERAKSRIPRAQGHERSITIIEDYETQQVFTLGKLGAVHFLHFFLENYVINRLSELLLISFLLVG